MPVRACLSVLAFVSTVVCACGDSKYQNEDVAHDAGADCDDLLASCSVDGALMLACKGGVFVEADACADGCVSGADGFVTVGPTHVCCDNGEDRACLSIH